MVSEILMIDSLLEKNLLPDALIRIGIRRLLAQRLRDETASSPSEQSVRIEAFAAALYDQPIAINTAESREQHYEVPTAFYQRCLGPRLKYSACWFETGHETLGQAEEKMLALTCERARLADGHHILELGCGWGSLTLWIAEHYPAAHITGVSHSATQREHITAEAARRGLGNVTILTCDMNDFDIDPGRFDRVVSVEMFEHMKNWPRLMGNIARWLKADGHLHPPQARVSFRGEGCDRLDEPVFFHRRNDAVGQPLHVLPGGPETGRPLARERNPLRKDRRVLVEEHGRSPEGTASAPGRDLRP
jgi:cyclopropane-fatty-acyl-phospholipid synthase